MLDALVFKRLSHNDSGQSRGHQGGIVIPKDLAEFFPPLPAVATALNPTVDVRLTADLFVDGARVATVETRYQYQTWGGTRSPERRLTDNLGPLRSVSSEGDIVLFAKDLEDDTYIQMHLVRGGTKEYVRLSSLLPKTNWGSVDPKDPPVSVTEIRVAEAFVEAQTKEKPSAFTEDRKTFETITVRKARDRAFRNAVLAQYDYRCAFTERRFVSPLSSKTMGLDAAHVIPVYEKGSDHPANGLPLTKELHWAFDRGLIGVNEDRTILVPRSVAEIVGNEFLKGLHGRSIQEAKNLTCRALDEAFAWHRANVLVG
jgi:putative restriction endonuclease